MEYPILTQTIEHVGQTVLIEYFHDAVTGAPWENAEGHGAVTRVHTYYGNIKKKPGQVVLHHGERNEYSYLYDFADTMEIAKSDGWNAEPYNPEEDTPGKKALRAVNADMDFLRGWCIGQWSYVGIVCTLLDSEGEKTDISESCWGFETFKDYHLEAGKEMAESLAESANRETESVTYWASRDVVTVGASV